MKKLPLSKPSQPDRLIGLTIPKDGQFFICDHDEVWRVAIGNVPEADGPAFPPASRSNHRARGILPSFNHLWGDAHGQTFADLWIWRLAGSGFAGDRRGAAAAMAQAQ
jgi:hypothetical protein